ncbi:MAG TPA: heavy-metal-associated domain-containing protein [Nocardioidaceae bacterium]|nr:heavy-metal-associated domain-containing protein [Nocardioidaceae bacterium]
MADTSTYTVTGMTCGHCVAAVTEEVSAIDGVHDVQVDLSSGRLTVVGEGVSTETVRAAVDEAGYGLTDTA